MGKNYNKVNSNTKAGYQNTKAGYQKEDKMPQIGRASCRERVCLSV